MKRSAAEHKSKKYKPIHSKTHDWPVVQLSNNRKQLIEKVVNETFEIISEKHTGEHAIREIIETTLHREQLRVRKNPWKVDPPDDYEYWNKIKNELVDLVAESNTKEKEEALLKSIVHRYTDEIAGNFKKSRYRFAREIIKFGFRRLLNATRVRKFSALFKSTYTLNDKIQVVGKAKQIRKLAKIGTVVMVPTHFSNLDSILIGWVIHILGLPAFIYGAGLNLFNIKILAYFMNSLGAYKVDRRKKNPIYLQALKAYSKLALEEGAHSLFFPGGTRSRSGEIESSLKLGLLGTAMEAQRSIFMKHPNRDGKKIFIVPVVINYNFVLEAPSLIKEHLSSTGQEKFYVESDAFSSSYNMIKFLVKFFTKGSDISLSIGKGMDLLGNYVDNEGKSIDHQGRIIDTRDYFTTDGIITIDEQRESEYTRRLSQIITKEFHRINRVFASHLVAFVAFRIWRKRFDKLDLYDFLRLPEEDMIIEYDEFHQVFEKAKARIMKLKKKKKINMAAHMKQPVSDNISLGIENVGMYHSRRPLLMTKDKKIITQDLLTLYYYHNRMHGYDLDKYI